jgi:ubiquinone/menaquinone biosynthesis C-methylase UbiE
MIGVESQGILKYLYQYPHYLMEKPFKSNFGFQILELGFGEGEHLPFVRSDFVSYTGIDSDEKRLMGDNTIGSLQVNKIVSDATQLHNFSHESFDRVIATCLLAHLDSPEKALFEWLRVLKTGGTLTVYIPAEPGIFLRLFRKLFTKPKAKKYGFDGYDLFIARDHKNDAQRLLTYFNNLGQNYSVIRKYVPFSWLPSWYLNLFCLVHVTKID